MDFSPNNTQALLLPWNRFLHMPSSYSQLSWLSLSLTALSKLRTLLMLNWFQGLRAAQWPGDLFTPQPIWSKPSECAQLRGTGVSTASQQLRQPYSLQFLLFLLPSVSSSWVKTKSSVLNSTLLPFFFFLHSSYRHLYIILHLVLSTAKIGALGTFTSERNIPGAQNPAKLVQSWVRSL